MRKNIRKRWLLGLASICILLSFCVSNMVVNADDTKWDDSYSWTSEVNASVNTDVKYGNSEYSIKIVNNGYDCGCIYKNFPVKPNTHYRASVMARYEGYELDPKWKGEPSGASLGKFDSYEGSGRHSGSEWKRLVFEFDTKDETSYTLALWNGMFCADCKGTAYFSDFRLEEYTGEKEKDWNVMVVFFMDVKAQVTMNGKTYIHKDSFNDKDVSYVSDIIKSCYSSVPLLSDGGWSMKGIDFYKSYKTVDTLGGQEDDYHIDEYSDVVSSELDRIIDQAYKTSGRKYDQIMIVSPISGLGGWAGLGGTKYKNIKLCQFCYKSGSHYYTNIYDNFFESCFIHEMLHCVESLSREINPQKTVELHDNESRYKSYYREYNQNGWDGWRKWYSDYMRSDTPDKLGVVPEAFEVCNGFDYITTYGEENRDTFDKIDIQRLQISKISTKEYKGKSVTPQVTIKDGSYKLKKNTDYTISYIENNSPGRACAVITGKGKYAGSASVVFDIIPKTPKLTKKDSKSISWKADKNADVYEIYVADKGSSNYRLLKKINGNVTSATIKVKKNSSIKIRSCKKLYPLKFYSEFSNSIKW